MAGVGVVNYIESQNHKWYTLKALKKREFFKVGAFLGTVGMFTAYGYGCARQAFIRRKLEIVQEHSIKSTG